MTDLPVTPIRPTVSVLVATLARPNQLWRALRSLRQQVRPANEVIVVFWEGDA